MKIIFGVSSRIWPRLKRDRRWDGHSPFGPPGQLAKREQPVTGNEEECRRVSILVAGKGDVRVGIFYYFPITYSNSPATPYLGDNQNPYRLPFSIYAVGIQMEKVAYKRTADVQSTNVDLRTLTMSKLTGDPPDDQNDNQVNLPRTALDNIKKMACRAFVQIQPAGSFEKAYNIISQDSSEPFTTFVDRVIQAAERQCSDDIARPIVIWDIIENNASPECKRAIKALGKERPTVPEMIDTCNQIGSPQHVAMIQANELGKTIGEKIERALTVQAAQAETRDQKVTEILAALHLSSQQEDNTMAVMQATVTSGPCYFCKRPGHILRNCPDIKRGVQAPDRCSTCKKGKHPAWQCQARQDISRKYNQ
ncbi:hypothetical protein DUI87_19596 [Hirundo rustica rustica]|uniref:CCHC-type domain-containing protein n=1 Tax=Hirundo rustica rustica TaxID=333673 RepID=A0A3M0JS12_HIRRU|nr:hypothetical protein DUI87_19596 [Hirundo rustica rustica]